MPDIQDSKELVQLDLLKQIGYGRKQSLHKLYKLTIKELYVYLHRLLCDKKCVDEVLIKTYLDVKETASQFDESTKVSTWIFTIARRHAMARLKSTAPRVGNSGANTAKGYKILDTHNALNSAMLKLDPKLREILGMILLPMATYKDVADRLNITEKMARHRVLQAMLELKKMLKSVEAN